MRRGKAVWFIALALFVYSGLRYGSAQAREEGITPSGTATHEQPPSSVHAYRVDFTINELQGGKKVNSRHYSMDLNGGDRNELKIGTRVPVVTGGGNEAAYQYLDVGTNISCHIREEGDSALLQVGGNFSNFSAGDEKQTSQTIVHAAPIIRQIKIDGSTLATLGKPVMIGAVDDPNSDRQFQLEATVTRLK